MEKSIPRGRLLCRATIEIIKRNGGEVGPQEIILRNIHQEKPYLNTGATMVTFKSGERIYCNECETWNDVWTFSSTEISDLPVSLDALMCTTVYQGKPYTNREGNSAGHFQCDRGPPQ